MANIHQPKCIASTPAEQSSRSLAAAARCDTYTHKLLNEPGKMKFLDVYRPDKTRTEQYTCKANTIP